MKKCSETGILKKEKLQLELALLYSLSMQPKMIQALADENNVFYRCVEDSSEAIMITDTKGILFYVNRAWQRMYGFSADDAVGNTPRMLRSPHQLQDFYRQMWKQILDPQFGYWKGELVNKAKDGSEVPVLLTITPYRDKKNVIQGYMGIALDMSQQKALEAQIIRQDRLASIGLLASGLAHEIGTPLGVIRGRAEYLSYLAAGSDDRLKSGLDVIITQIDRISKLIYSLLHLARSEKSESARSVSAAEVVRQVKTLMDQKLTKNEIEFESELGDHVHVIAETDKLTQVVLNLTMNAIHAIESKMQKDQNCLRKIRVFAKESGENWNLVFQDSGVGISTKNMNHLFKPFFTTKEVGTGTGLGLAISLQIVQSWGGNITVTSTEGLGSSFQVTLRKA